MNVLEFQYTKAIEQAITKKQEATIAHIDPKIFRAAVLSSPNGVEGAGFVNENKRALTVSEEALLAEKLGVFKSIFSAAALVIQALFASRIITGLGVVGGMLLHPIVMLMSLVGMFLKFGFTSSFISKINFEMTNVVYKNSYFASHYAFPKTIRDQSAEFLKALFYAWNNRRYDFDTDCRFFRRKGFKHDDSHCYVFNHGCCAFINYSSPASIHGDYA